MRDWSVEEFMTVAEVAALLKLNHQTVRNWIDAGTLPAVQIGRRVRVLRSDLEELIDRGYRSASEQTTARTPPGIWKGQTPSDPKPADR